jgi:uncharacterized lipoprotein YmbA
MRGWLLALVAAGGCALLGGGRSTPPKFYALSAIEPSDGPGIGSRDVTLGLGPVTIPGYLDRPQLVRRLGPNELRLVDSARWGEPLREGIVRTLRQNILGASGVRRVVPYPWLVSPPVDLAVAVDVLRFERDADDHVALVARWTLRETLPGGVLAVRESRFEEPMQGKDTADEVAALSRALGALGREIATGVQDAQPLPRQ